jgi:hypothetical protein
VFSGLNTTLILYGNGRVPPDRRLTSVRSHDSKQVPRREPLCRIFVVPARRAAEATSRSKPRTAEAANSPGQGGGTRRFLRCKSIQRSLRYGPPALSVNARRSCTSLEPGSTLALSGHLHRRCAASGLRFATTRVFGQRQPTECVPLARTTPKRRPLPEANFKGTLRFGPTRRTLTAFA